MEITESTFERRVSKQRHKVRELQVTGLKLTCSMVLRDAVVV